MRMRMRRRDKDELGNSILARPLASSNSGGEELNAETKHETMASFVRPTASYTLYLFVIFLLHVLAAGFRAVVASRRVGKSFQ